MLVQVGNMSPIDPRLASTISFFTGRASPSMVVQQSCEVLRHFARSVSNVKNNNGFGCSGEIQSVRVLRRREDTDRWV
jgi:hypothetical protein